jgi:hypothetical protein
MGRRINLELHLRLGEDDDRLDPDPRISLLTCAEAGKSKGSPVLALREWRAPHLTIYDTRELGAEEGFQSFRNLFHCIFGSILRLSIFPQQCLEASLFKMFVCCYSIC